MTTLALAPRISFAGLTSKQNNASLSIFAVAAYALSSLMALTVAGGIRMFYAYLYLDEAPMLDPKIMNSAIPEIFFNLSCVAGGLLVMPIFSLGASAARLGARDRTRRLASLRLIGMTSGQTTALALIESTSQWLFGTAIGIAAYWLTIPAWASVSFMREPIHTDLMRLPLWEVAIVIAGLFSIMIVSTIAGLSRVRISPLGVSRREPIPGVRMWRPILFVCTFIAFVRWTSTQASYTTSYAIVVLSILTITVVLGVLVVGSWVLQVLVLPWTRSSMPAVMLAARRILDDPRAAWRPIATLAIMSLIGGFVAIAPATSDEMTNWVFRDILTGVTITLCFAFAVSALSTLMNQASAVFDRADQSVALASMGMPRSLFTHTRIIQIIGPLVVTSLASAAVGCAMGTVAATQTIEYSGIGRMFAVIGIGVLLCLAALLLCEPIERRVIASRGRRND